MKKYTAIYNTATVTGMKYDFTAKSDDHAVKCANIKFDPEAQSSLRLFEGEREISYSYNAHEQMSVTEKEMFVGGKFVK